MTPAQIEMILTAAIELLEIVKNRDEDDIIELEDFFPRIADLRDKLKASREARRVARKEE
jgi:hypothetical protein